MIRADRKRSCREGDGPGSRSPRLLICSHNYHPEPIGIPFYNTAMARWWASHGWRVEVCTGLPHYPWWRVPESYAQQSYRGGKGDECDGAVLVRRIRHFVPSAPVSGSDRIRLDASFLAGWARRLWSLPHRPQVIILVAPPFLIGLLGMLMRWRWRVPVVMHIQDLQVDAALDMDMLPRRLGPVLSWLERFQLARMDQVTACSQAMVRRIRSKGPTRRPVVWFPNWVDPDAMRPWTGVNSYRQSWDVESGQVVCMYSGNFGRKQGLDDLCACMRLLADDEHILFAIAGSGAEAATVQQALDGLPPGRGHLLELQPLKRLAEFLSAADIHCLPQKRAVSDLVMPSKLLNIMAVARPVVVAADPDTELARTVQRAGCGLVVAPENPEAFAAGLRRLTSDRRLRERMGRSGRAYVVRHLSEERVLGSMARRLRRLVGR